MSITTIKALCQLDNTHNGCTEINVADNILALSLAEIHRLKDFDLTTDLLMPDPIQAGMVPRRVQVVDEVCQYFGVHNLRDVTEDMLLAARQGSWRLKPYLVSVVTTSVVEIFAADADQAQKLTLAMVEPESLPDSKIEVSAVLAH